MAPLIPLEGNTLGDKHKSLNAKVNELVSAGTKLNHFEDSDVKQLIQIEVAAKCRNVEYIIEVLKCEDMLYVSRAIRKCRWLITDQQYAHLINPQHLQTHLFPHMTTKAVNKLLLHIRLNLKDENRVNDFYKYYEKINLNTSMKWLPNCSIDVILEATKNHPNNLNSELFKRLCKKSFAVFENYNFETYRSHNVSYRDVMFLLNTHTEKFLDVVEKTHEYSWPRFGKKYTAVIMKNCPKRILEKFQKYANNIDIETFGKHLGPDHIKDFIVKEAETFPSFMLKYKNVKPLIKLMPKEDKFEFLKDFFINKKRKEESKEGVNVVQSDFAFGSCAMLMKRKMCAYGRGNQASSQHVYEWYRHAPFNVAFAELKKLIRAESSPEERGAIFRVLLTSAGQNMNNISALIQYYNKNHINEPFKFKVNFVNAIISTTQTHKYDEKTWTLLQELFHSMEVYIESDNNVQICVTAILVYNIIRKLPIPYIVEKKFNFVTLKHIQNKLTAEEKEAVFQYLYNSLEEKLKKETATDRAGFYNTVQELEMMLNLLVDWNKDLKDFLTVIEKIKTIVFIQQDRKYDAYLENIYYKKKNWSKYMIDESLLIARRPKVCMNLLKHRPELLQKYEAEVEKMRIDDNINLNCFLSKLRVYWPETGEQWTRGYLGRLEQTNGQKATVRALCVLLPHNELQQLIEKYAPDDIKIVWGQMDNSVLGIRKYLSKQMYMSRPPPTPQSVLLYARGDYLQFALASLNSIFHNISSIKAREVLPRLLDNVVSLKKHGIRVAFSKLEYEELRETLLVIWGGTKNASLRAVMFKETFDFMCREQNQQKVEEIWSLLENFIDNLGLEENKLIYVLLGKANEAPSAVIPRFYVKSYKLLKSLPPKMNCEKLAEQIVGYMPMVMDRLDTDFIAGLILEFISEWFGKGKILKKPNYGHPYVMLELISTYLLQISDEMEQRRRYDQVLSVMCDHCTRMWTDGVEGQRVGEQYFIAFVNKLIEIFNKTVSDKKSILPEHMFKKIVDQLENKLSVPENYQTILYCKLIIVYVNCCKNKKYQIDLISSVEDKSDVVAPYGRGDNKRNEIWSIVRGDFGKACVVMMKEEIDKYFPSVRELFSGTLRQFYSMVSSEHNDVEFARSLIEGHDFTPMYLTAIELSHVSYHVGKDDPNKEKIEEYRKMLLSHPSSEVKMHFFKKY